MRHGHAFEGADTPRATHLTENPASGNGHRLESHVFAPVSVIAPTRNEAANIAPLVARLERVLPDGSEIVFVDDSDDDTPAVIESMASRSRCPIRLIHRPPGQRAGGLGGAVVAGLRTARSAWDCVMDADLQHPPELIPRLLAQARLTQADLVIASRYCGEGKAEGLDGIRTAISRASTTAARLAFPRRLRRVSDPMSGFFLLRKDLIDLDALQPRGFKILLEILVRNRHLKVSEVGFEFGKRHAGESKASLREGLRYLAHLGTLRLGSDALRFAAFAAIGLSGLVVNTLVLLAGTELVGFHYLLSVVFATWASTLWNFSLTDAWVFGDRREANRWGERLAMFAFVNTLALLVRGPMIYVLTSLLGIYYVFSNIVSLVALSLVRYGMSDAWIWKATHRPRARGPYCYDIHGIVTVWSETWLPELERFLTSEPIDRPTIRVRIGGLRSPGPLGHPGTVSATPNGQRFFYDDGLGPLGFWIDVTIGETVEVIASPFLRRSPHVLYTNVVEPILRWTFVRKGYALVHGACIAFGDQAYLVTARTDTGKTTTILRVLDRQRRATDTGAFLSDDLTLLSPDGQALSYPKPMTISRHTVAAVNTPMLSRRQRLGLWVQSRLHSREGRRFALLLAQTRLPVATVNAMVQWIVPPPKYHIQQLVPRSKWAREAKLAGVFVIERGGEGEIPLDDRAALETLLSNSDDAYGFPPYPTIRHYLHGLDEQDLRPVEQQIVAQALSGVPARLLRSSTMDWWQRIPALVNLHDLRPAVEQPASPVVATGASVT